MHIFKAKGYKTFEGAAAKMNDTRIRAMAGTATYFIAAQHVQAEGMRYFPVVIYRDGVQINVGGLIHNGVTVLN